MDFTTAHHGANHSIIRHGASTHPASSHTDTKDPCSGFQSTGQSTTLNICSDTKAMLDNHVLNQHLMVAYILRDHTVHDLKITIGGHDTEADYVYYNPIPLAQAVLEHANRMEQKLLDSLEQGDPDTFSIYMDLLSAAHYMDGANLALDIDNSDTADRSLLQLDDLAVYINTGQFPPDYEARQNEHTQARDAADYLHNFNRAAHFDIHQLTFEEAAKGATHWNNQVLEYRENSPSKKLAPSSSTLWRTSITRSQPTDRPAPAWRSSPTPRR